jgi:hypothetical protein
MSPSTIGKGKARAQRAGPKHPPAVPILGAEESMEDVPDQPFAEGALDNVDPDLRHRMISEAAYRRYVERGYADGDDVDDWLEAEADVEHLLLNRRIVPRGSPR